MNRPLHVQYTAALDVLGETFIRHLLDTSPSGPGLFTTNGAEKPVSCYPVKAS